MSEKDISYSKIVALIRKQINQVRVNPISLSGYLNSKKVRFDNVNPLMFYPLKKTKQLCVKTKQGFKESTAVQQLDKHQLNQTSSQRLIWSYQLHLIAHKKAVRLSKCESFLGYKHVVEQVIEMVHEEQNIHYVNLKAEGQDSYMGRSTSRPTSRESVANLQKSMRQGVQCILDDQYYITYYGVIDPKEIVSQLLIDDGFPKRCKRIFNQEHRRALLNKKMNHIGIGISEHPSQYFVVVIILANHVKQLQSDNNLSDVPTCQCNLI